MENTNKFYAGVGSRKTPPDVLVLMTKVAKYLDSLRYCLRSGGAKGADQAFQEGATNKEIFFANDAIDEAIAIAAKYHPAWNRVGSYARLLHGRNAFQILGGDLKTPVKFMICWTPDGCINHETRKCETGGTGTAISIAYANNIEIFNLAIPEHRARIESKIGG